MDISKLNKAEVLASLYNNSRPLGLGFLHFDPEPMTIEEAAEILKTQQSFDYYKGRVRKVNLSGDELYTSLYNRDNGDGSAERALAGLLSE